MIVLDSGALLASEKHDNRVRMLIDEFVTSDSLAVVPAPVLAQVWRGGPQPVLSRLLKACDVVPFGEALTREVGAALARSRTNDIVDATVVVVAALEPGSSIITSDPKDISRIVDALNAKVRVLSV